jgi:hypothetical protein
VRVKNEELPEEKTAIEVINLIINNHISQNTDNKQNNPPSLIV